jgi:hypothetical protein
MMGKPGVAQGVAQDTRSEAAAYRMYTCICGPRSTSIYGGSLEKSVKLESAEPPQGTCTYRLGRHGRPKDDRWDLLHDLHLTRLQNAAARIRLLRYVCYICYVSGA